MSASVKLVDKLEGVENFHAWKYRIGLILKKNDLARFVKEKVPEPADVVEKEKHQKDTIRAKRSIVDSIKDHLIPYVSSVNVYAIIIVLCISIYKSIIRTRSLRNTHSQETQHLSWETL
jgi:hypothetical protein